MEEQIAPKVGQKEKKSFWQSSRELIFFALLSLAIVAPIRIFIAQPFIVSGSSMYPTFSNNDYLIVDEISYRLGEPERYDVVIFHYPVDTSKFFIKRIIGLPGETVDIKGKDVTIQNNENPNGFKLDQSFINNEMNSTKHYVLKDDEYFVLGDNRNASSDSRVWGAVPKKLLIGKAFVRLYPFNKIDFKPGDYKLTK
ncbi:MAG: signal peptidase I [Candidatus Paceibacterota bacterium]|jgi:signal peptidase I